jgi:hypothetical protein
MHTGDELALDFDNWRKAALDNFRSDMTSEEVAALDAIDGAFSEFGADCWKDDAVRTSARWENVRRLSVMALRSFNWPEESPPSYAHEYVKARTFHGSRHIIRLQ